MSDFEKLKEKDIEEIYHKTYIARKYIKALLEKDFSKFDRLKALGFVKILEREFDYDLSDLKKDIDEYFAKKSLITSKDEKIEDESIKNLNIKKKKESKILPILAIVIFGLFLIIYFMDFSKKETKEIKKEKKEQFFEKKEQNLTKDLVAKESKIVKKENNITKESNVEKNDENITLEKEDLKAQVEQINPMITIVPKQKVWVGIVYLDDYSKKSFITSNPIELNTSRDQLIVTGHGNIDIEIDGNVTNYTQKGKLRFLYRAKELEKIDKETFLKYNRGKNW